ncbi:MAG: ornithine cyclodeaminase, partial [Lachnospiraceae bacterium]|nr:ornithine cyclodeaminase [Lachnospiraceae bacterium]MDY4164741.1 ornithine cyclodeaminase [Lachnospiraceae bacterium]
VETGAPLAYMSANLLSSIRTGAMPGLAAKLLAIKDSKTLALIGAGPIGKSSVMAILSKIKTIEEIKIKGSTPESATAKEAKEFIEVNFPWVKKVTVAETLEEAIRDSDIVTEAVSCKEGEWPEYKAEWIKPGATVISTSTFNMDYKSILPFKKVVDNIGMYENYADEDNEGYDSEGRRNHTGCMGEDFVYMVRDGLMKMDDISELGQIVRGKREGRVSDDEIILVSIEGMPVEDVAWGYECYKNAKENLIGRPLKLWDSPITF